MYWVITIITYLTKVWYSEGSRQHIKKQSSLYELSGTLCVIVIFIFNHHRFKSNFRRLFPPSLLRPTLAVMGLFQTKGPIMPIVEMQARWAAKVFTGKFLTSFMHAHKHCQVWGATHVSWCVFILKVWAVFHLRRKCWKSWSLTWRGKWKGRRSLHTHVVTARSFMFFL